MRIDCSLPVALSLAETCTMPLASMSKVTSICGTPRGAGGMPTRSNWPSSLLSAAISRSPWHDADGDGVLAVLGGRERLALLGRDRRVAIDQSREHAAQRLDAERQRRHVEQQDVLDLALQHAALDGGADGDDLVRVDALVRLLAEQLLDDFLHLRHARHAADENDFVDLGCLEAGILERLFAGAFGAADEVVDQAFELGARELHRQMLRTRRVGRDERQVDLGLRGARQLDLGLLGGFLQALQGELVGPRDRCPAPS